MADHPLSEHLLRFFSTHVQSIERLEILCLLVDHRKKSWSADEVFRRIQSTEKSVAECLEHFVQHDLATGDAGSGFRFSEKTSEATEAALKLAEAYRERRVAVIEAVYTRPPKSVQNFPAAFRRRKDK
jgi:hypothetical protein